MPDAIKKIYIYISSFVVLIICTIDNIKSSIYIYLYHRLNGLLYIIYPLILYFLIHFPSYFQVYKSSKSSFECIQNFLKIAIVPRSYLKELPHHVCYSSPSQVRTEVSFLKNVFNDRLKFILFRSLLIVYFSCFLPLFLVSPNLIYDSSVTTQHCIISWISIILMLTSHLYSPQFYDILHKSSLHLGKWQKLENRNSFVPVAQWSENAIYFQGVVIKYYKEYYKAEGFINCAEPANQSHLRYYVSYNIVESKCPIKIVTIIYSLFFFLI